MLVRDAPAEAEDDRLSAYPAAVHLDRACTGRETEVKTGLGP